VEVLRQRPAAGRRAAQQRHLDRDRLAHQRVVRPRPVAPPNSRGSRPPAGDRLPTHQGTSPPCAS
jgi:hypothetical protein